jgi:hypothetical protein
MRDVVVAFVSDRRRRRGWPILRRPLCSDGYCAVTARKCHGGRVNRGYMPTDKRCGCQSKKDEQDSNLRDGGDGRNRNRHYQRRQCRIRYKTCCLCRLPLMPMGRYDDRRLVVVVPGRREKKDVLGSRRRPDLNRHGRGNAVPRTSPR